MWFRLPISRRFFMVDSDNYRFSGKLRVQRDNYIFILKTSVEYTSRLDLRSLKIE